VVQTAAHAAVAAVVTTPSVAAAVAAPLASAAPAAARPAPHRADYSTERGELTDATPDADGLYHVKSSSGGGLGGTLTKEQYDNLRQSDRASRNQTTGNTLGARTDAGPDSIAQWRAGHAPEQDSIAKRGALSPGRGADATPTTAAASTGGRVSEMGQQFTQLSRSIDQLTSTVRGGGVGGRPGNDAKPGNVTNNYNITVQAKTDAAQTAGVIANLVHAQLQKVQKNHDEQLAGAVTAATTAATMGGS
jgi:hypothetical protein